MAEDRLPFLRGRIERTDAFQSPQGGGGAGPKLPPRDPAGHSLALLGQLDALTRAATNRLPGSRDPDARREIVAVRPEPGFEVDPDKLGDRRSDLRAVAADPATGVVILDAADPALEPLVGKVRAYGDPSRKSAKTGEPRNARGIAPVGGIELARLDDLLGPRIRAEPPDGAEPRWFEIGCRGGLRRPTGETESSRLQVRRQMHRLGLPAPRDFVATEQIFFFAHISLDQLRQLLAAVDCCYELDLAEAAVRDWLAYEDYSPRQARAFQLDPPRPDAPAVVLLDTGVRTRHPLLQSAILDAQSVVPGDPSPEDEHRHGTEMAGVGLYGGRLGEALELGRAVAPHWLQSIRLLARPGAGSAAAGNRAWWPRLTADAVAAAEQDSRPRVFALAVTGDPAGETATLWSHAIDQLAYSNGVGRLFCVSAGNADVNSPSILDGYPQLNLSQRLQEPAQAFNALTVGAFTGKTTLPPDPMYADVQVVAPAGGISPSTSAGRPARHPLKPDLLFEGGNVARSGDLADVFVPTLSTVTTGLDHLTRPLSLIAQTSEATARAAHLAAAIWSAEPGLRPETVRGLMVHCAEWTPAMREQFPNDDERLAACGYGVPDEAAAVACSRHLATVIVEDQIPNAVARPAPAKQPGRCTKLFRLPIPEVLAGLGDARAEVRVTLSYFAEPNLYRRTTSRGLDLRWDMQGPAETEPQFLARVNKLQRGSDRESDGSSYDWEIGPRGRRRSTVQSDRWKGRAALLAGPKLLAVMPVLGWWERRDELRNASMRFSLIASVHVPGFDVYTPIALALEIEAQIEVSS